MYGITAAAEHYFGRTPAELNLGECLFLSSLLPAPHPLRRRCARSGEVPEGVDAKHLHTLMQIAHSYGRISDAELAEGEKEPIVFWHGGERPPAASARPRADPTSTRRRRDDVQIDARLRRLGRSDAVSGRQRTSCRARAARRRSAAGARRTRRRARRATTSKRWFRRASRPIEKSVVTAPAFGSSQP